MEQECAYNVKKRDRIDFEGLQEQLDVERKKKKQKREHYVVRIEFNRSMYIWLSLPVDLSSDQSLRFFFRSLQKVKGKYSEEVDKHMGNILYAIGLGRITDRFERKTFNNDDLNVMRINSSRLKGFVLREHKMSDNLPQDYWRVHVVPRFKCISIENQNITDVRFDAKSHLED